jgi:hypothetical protein
MSMVRLIAVSFIVLMFSIRAFGCFCFSTPMCAQRPTLGAGAVFVGRVVEVWPTRETIAKQFHQHAPLVSLRRSLLTRWHGALSPEEERYIRTKNRSDIESHYAYMQRARFEVMELFAGAATESIFTESTSCGYQFRVGDVYLVNAWRDGPRYKTGACSRTGPIYSREVVEDVKALRASRGGESLAPRIYGYISREGLRTGIQIHLLRKGGHDRESRIPDSDGAFSFDDLDRTEYRLQIEDSRGTAETTVDLWASECFEAELWFDDEWKIAGSPVLIESSPMPPPLDVPAPVLKLDPPSLPLFVK